MFTKAGVHNYFLLIMLERNFAHGIVAAQYVFTVCKLLQDPFSTKILWEIIAETITHMLTALFPGPLEWMNT